MADDLTMKDNVKSNISRWLIYAAVLLIVFLLGLIPMWLQKRAVADELTNTQQQLRKSEIRGLLTTAIVESSRGEYEPARKDTSSFFTRLAAEIDKGDKSALTEEERGKLKTIFNDRDATITMLAQRDQASVQRLTDIYEIYQKAVGQNLTAAPAVSPTTATSPAMSPNAPTTEQTQPTP